DRCMQKDLPKPEDVLPEPELELSSGIQNTKKPRSKSSLQLFVVLITIFCLLGVLLSVVFYLLKTGQLHF
ncbi:MAG: hypothetical protein ACHQT7_01595, partial [Candidatus Levyibacteriota bacterium]